jgi:hypothetical protein
MPRWENSAAENVALAVFRPLPRIPLRYRWAVRNDAAKPAIFVAFASGSPSSSPV